MIRFSWQCSTRRVIYFAGAHEGPNAAHVIKSRNTQLFRSIYFICAPEHSLQYRLVYCSFPSSPHLSILIQLKAHPQRILRYTGTRSKLQRGINVRFFSRFTFCTRQNQQIIMHQQRHIQRNGTKIHTHSAHHSQCKNTMHYFCEIWHLSQSCHSMAQWENSKNNIIINWKKKKRWENVKKNCRCRGTLHWFAQYYNRPEKWKKKNARINQIMSRFFSSAVDVDYCRFSRTFCAFTVNVQWALASGPYFFFCCANGECVLCMVHAARCTTRSGIFPTHNHEKTYNNKLLENINSHII